MKPGVVKIGFGDIGFYDKRYNRTVIDNRGQIFFLGETFIGEGAKITCGKHGVISFGNNFRNSGGLTICCEKQVCFKENVLVGWNTTIMDSDYHNLINIGTNQVYPKTLPVYIGKDTWIAIEAVILKGTHIPDGSIVGAGSVVHGRFKVSNILIAGNPAKVIKYGVKRHVIYS